MYDDWFGLVSQLRNDRQDTKKKKKEEEDLTSGLISKLRKRHVRMEPLQSVERFRFRDLAQRSSPHLYPD